MNPAMSALVRCVATIKLHSLSYNETKITWSSVSTTQGLSHQVIDGIHTSLKAGYNAHIGSLAKFVAEEKIVKAHVSVDALIEGPIEDTFPLLADFAGWMKWAEQFEFMNTTNGMTGVGQIREYKMLPSGVIYSDKLTALDTANYSLSYTLLTMNPAMAALVSCVATVKLESLGDNQTKITWGSISKTKGLGQQVIDGIHTALKAGYNAHIGSLAKFVAAEKIIKGHVSVDAVIQGPIEDTFPLLTDFAGWMKWAEQFEFMNTTNGITGVGQIREYKMLPSGVIYSDQLIALDDKNHSISYNLLTMNPAMAALVSCVATVKLDSLSDNETKITWSSVSKTKGLTQQVIDGIHTALKAGYNAHIGSLAKFVAAENIIKGHVSVDAVIPGPIEDTFPLLTNFAGWMKWAEQFEFMNTTNGVTGVGQIREYKMLPSGVVYSDELIALDDKHHSISYNLLTMNPAMSALISCVATVKLESLCEKETKITWSSVSRTKGLSQQVIDGVHTALKAGYNAHIGSLSKYVAAQQVSGS